MKYHRVIVVAVHSTCHYRSVHGRYQVEAAAVRVVDPLVVASPPLLLQLVIPPPTLVGQTTTILPNNKKENMYVVYNTTMDTTQDRLI